MRLALRQRQRTAPLVLDASMRKPREDAPCLRAKAARERIKSIELTPAGPNPVRRRKFAAPVVSAFARPGIPRFTHGTEAPPATRARVMDPRELRYREGKGAAASLSIARARGVIVIFVALPFVAVLLGVAPQFVGGVVLWMLAVATAGYAMAQLIWEAASAS